MTELNKKVNKGYAFLTFYFPDATKIADGDVVTGVTPGFPGKIVNWFWVTTTAFSTPSKDTVLNLEINEVDVKMPDGVTNSTIDIDSDLQTTLGEVVAGTAIGQGWASFDKDDTISIEASGTTTFGEGAGVIVLVLEYNYLS